MKTSLKKLSIFVLILACSFLISLSNASAQALPYTGSAGNYTYTQSGATGSLTFSSNYLSWVEYTDYTFYDAFDPISNYAAEVVFGSLTNSSGNPTNFGSSLLTVREMSNPGNIFFTATINNFDTTLGWMTLSNITAGNVGSGSRYVTELLAVGNGSGNLQISFTPGSGGVEDFVGSSSGSVGITIAAPEPVSSVLFITGGAVLGFRRFRGKRIK